MDNPHEQLGFTAWANSPRTVALMQRCTNAEQARNKLRLEYDSLQQKHQQLEGPLCRYVGKLALAAHEQELAVLRVEMEREVEALKHDMEKYVERDSQYLAEIDKLESELRSSKAVLESYIRLVVRRRERIDELERKLKNYEPISLFDNLNIEQWRERALRAEEVVKVDSAFIELQAKRLIRARNNIQRVRQVVDNMWEPEDDAGLDP